MGADQSQPRPHDQASQAARGGPGERIWFDEVRRLTVALVGIRSVSPSADENRVGEAIVRLLREGQPDDAYAEVGLAPIPGDPWGRANAYALVRGRSPQTVALMGHFDTVDTADYGALEPWALDPDGLGARRDALAAVTPGVREDLAAAPDDWMFGRGVADMKSGVAICIALLRHYAALAREGRLPLSVVMIATPDEENESAGAREVPRLLERLATAHGLTYTGAINTDYVAERYPGDTRRPVYTGSVGKLLPCFYVIGQTAHVGEPFAGLDVNLALAELISEFSMNPAYCETVRGQTTPPPVTLRATDTKTHYNAQLPFTAYLYLNLLTLERSPAEALEALRAGARSALNRVAARMRVAERQWTLRHGAPPSGIRDLRDPVALTWAELRAEVAARLGEDTVAGALADEWARMPAEGPANATAAPIPDKRERCVRLVQRLWALSEREGPAVVVFFAPPFYPAVRGKPSPLLDALRATITTHPEWQMVEEEYFPLLSDMSYLRLDPDVDAEPVRANMPVWRDDAASASGAYSLPLGAMLRLALPVMNIGPYGRAVHQRGERALMSFSFEVAPRAVDETIQRLAELVEPGVDPQRER